MCRGGFACAEGTGRVLGGSEGEGATLHTLQFTPAPRTSAALGHSLRQHRPRVWWERPTYHGPLCIQRPGFSSPGMA